MGTIESLNKKYLIMDNDGNYYRLDASGQMVVADGRIDAVFFTYEEASSKIGNGKKSHYYKIMPADALPPISHSATEDTASSIATENCSNQGNTADKTPVSNTESDNPLFRWDLPDLPDLSGIDWLMYLKNFMYVATNIPDYKIHLRAIESKVDQVIVDLLHYVEFYDLDNVQIGSIMAKIKTAREFRRDIKNELYRVGQFHSVFGTSNNICFARTVINAIEKSEASKYRLRVLNDLFSEVRSEEKRQVVCFRDMVARYENIFDSDNDPFHSPLYDNPACSEEGVYEEVHIERTNTIFDKSKMNWPAFVKQQAEFFRFAREHIQNLELDLNKIDTLIEEALKSCEDAKLNVAQGDRKSVV